MYINYSLQLALIFRPLSSSFACLLSGRLCILSTFGIDFFQSWICTHLIISFPNVSCCLDGLSPFYPLCCPFLPLAVCFLAHAFAFSLLLASSATRPSILCISLCFNLARPQRYQLRKQGHLLAFIAEDKLSGLFDTSQVRESQAHAKPWPAFGVKLKTRPP